jgi:hypothetical protein
MWRIGLKMLMGDRAKYFTLVGGVSVVVFLFVQQGSVFCGLIGRTAKPVEAIGAPIWVVDRNLQVVDEFKGLLDTDLLRVRSVEGVKWAVPLFIRQAQVRLPNGKFQAVRLVGIDSATLVGRPPRLLEGRIEDLNAPDAVIVGRAEMERLGSPKMATPLKSMTAGRGWSGLPTCHAIFFPTRTSTRRSSGPCSTCRVSAS